MDERVLSFRVGVVVVAAVLITVILIFLFGEAPWPIKPTYSVLVRFPRAPGVSENTPVRKSGVTVGRVSDVTLLPEGGVLLKLRLDKDKPIRMNEYPRISTGSLVTGDAVVEFVLDENNPKTDLLKDQDFLPDGMVVHDPFEVLMNLEGRMADAFTSIEDTATKASRILDNLQWLGTEKGRFDQLVSKTETALDSFNQAMTSIDEILGDEVIRQQLRDALADLPAVFREAKQTLEETRKTMAGFEKVTRRAEVNLENLEQFTKPLGERGDRIISSVEGSAANLDALLEQLVNLTRSINQGQGTVGRLVHDEEIYLQIKDTVKNIDDVSKKLRPILNDVRVFTDKIARDPRQLGIKGALDRRPSGSGIKPSAWLEE
jgi:phospholipid/cholesterol/gamma-HCH transport system substrate-binding protein